MYQPAGCEAGRHFYLIWCSSHARRLPNYGRRRIEHGEHSIPYASLIGALMYAAIGTRPDIAFAVGALSCCLSNPGRRHWNEAKRVLTYLKGTSHYAIGH